MAQKSTFQFVNIGQSFFDPYSGETFRKTDSLKAVYETGGDYFEGNSSIFYPEDPVEIV